MTGPHWKPRTDELRANYTHGPCDAAIIEGRDKDACEGCRQGVGRCVANRPPTWADLPQGCYPTMTGGMTPEDYIAYGRGDQSAALTAVRSGSDQTVELRAKVVLLETELADMRAELATVTEERDRWYARWNLAQDELDAQVTPGYRAAFPEPRTHDGIRADKAIRPRGQA